ncbi:MAG: ATP synthase F0 subunit C [Bacteroidales bacterium]|jgi:F-type H+-transporting ATPase subunit c
MLLSVLLQTGFSFSFIATLAAAIVVLAASFGISKIGASAVDAMARQPEAASSIRTSLVLAGAFIEGVSLFAIVVCLLAL